jgi:hypothetical protein
MRVTVALSAAMLLIPPVAAFAQGATDRGDQSSNIGPAAENRDNGPLAALLLRVWTLTPSQIRSKIAYSWPM